LKSRVTVYAKTCNLSRSYCPEGELKLPPPSRNFEGEGRELAAEAVASSSSLQGETTADPPFICPAHDPMREGKLTFVMVLG